MPNMNNIIGSDGCDLDYKGSDFDPREDDESFVQRKLDKFAQRKIDRKVNKAVKGFWEGIDAESK
jgi:hypothetical protein